MENLITSLEGLGFSNLEVKIYLTLLDYGAMSPYQIAKKIDISRSSIYNTLEHMVSKGMVEVIPEDTVMYVAQEPEVLMGKIEGKYVQNMKDAKQGLEHYLSSRYEEKSAIINGYEIIMEKAKNMIKNAKEEVFINTDIDLGVLKESFTKAIEKGVRIIVLGMGSKGALLYVKEEKKFYEFPAVTVGKVVNTVGAGDALFSSFIHFYAKGFSAVEALKYAEIFASYKIGFDGASNGFAEEEKLQELVKRYAASMKVS